jgi:hypothetical protein
MMAQKKFPYRDKMHYWLDLMEEAERQAKADPDFREYWQAKIKEAEEKIDTIASQIMEEDSRQ